MNTNKIYHYTKKPNLFKNTYWGQFDKKNIDNEIVLNRNRFVIDYDIKKKSSLNKEVYFYLKELIELNVIDHLEIYKNRNNEYVVVISPYTKKHDTIFKSCGFKEIYKLYNNNAYTYIRVY